MSSSMPAKTSEIRINHLTCGASLTGSFNMPRVFPHND
jgi:hypothetical protein